MEQATEKMWNTISCASKMKFNTKFFVSSRIMQRQSYFQFEFKDIVWKNVIIFLYLHGAAVYGIYLLAIGEAKLMTFILGMQWWLFFSFDECDDIEESTVVWLQVTRMARLERLALQRVRIDCGHINRTKPHGNWDFCWPRPIWSHSKIASMNGFVIIGCITNTPTQMPIRTIRSVASSSRTWAGWCCESIPMSNRRAQTFRWPIWNKMKSLCSRKGGGFLRFVLHCRKYIFPVLSVSQTLSVFDADIRVHHTVADSVSCSRREIVVFDLHCWSLTLHDDIAFHVARE